MAESNPVAFMSFVSSDFQQEEGRITQFRDRLADEVSMHSTEDLLIFQDRDDISWSQYWKERVEESLDATTFLIPFITPTRIRPSCRGCSRRARRSRFSSAAASGSRCGSRGGFGRRLSGLPRRHLPPSLLRSRR